MKSLPLHNDDIKSLQLYESLPTLEGQDSQKKLEDFMVMEEQDELIQEGVIMICEQMVELL